MTEAVILALIALAGLIVFTTTTIVLVGMTLKAAPTRFKFWTKYGHFEVSFDSKADK